VRLLRNEPEAEQDWSSRIHHDDCDTRSVISWARRAAFRKPAVNRSGSRALSGPGVPRWNLAGSERSGSMRLSAAAGHTIGPLLAYVVGGSKSPSSDGTLGPSRDAVARSISRIHPTRRIQSGETRNQQCRIKHADQLLDDRQGPGLWRNRHDIAVACGSQRREAEI
jgi:hypothetical protein